MWVSLEIERNNCVLLVVEYFCGFNMMLLIFRIFGFFFEIFEGVGII